jgi:GNAT superfamily N-acetyltransferase
VTLDPDDVRARIAEWIWVPEEARTVDDDEFLLIAYPAYFSDPTVATRWHSERPADELIDDVLAAAQGLGRSSVNFFDLSDTTRPPDLERRLRERGAEQTETLAVLAGDLTSGIPDLDVPHDVEPRPITDVTDVIALERLDHEVFGGQLRPEDDVAADFAAKGPDPSRVLAWRGDALVGVAGYTVAGDSLRLWGGAVAENARHTGVYRALLDHRLRAGLAEGCRVALVKGRVDTSAPVLLRAGFEEYGEVRAYRLGRS